MVDDRAAGLGTKHGTGERPPALVRRVQRVSTDVCHECWAPIVAAIRTLAATYNAGVENEILHVLEERPGLVKIQTGHEAGPSLLAGLEGTFISVYWCNGHGVSCETEQPLQPERSPDDTAAYLLHNWMARL